MAKRLSSLFSLSKDTSSNDLPHAVSNPVLHDSVQSSPESSPHMGKLLKNKPIPRPPSTLELDAVTGPLPPPPLVTDRGVRPMSRNSKPASRDTSVSTRGSSAGSRPQTPTMLGVPTTASPIVTNSPTSAKLSKKKSWIPGRSDKGTLDNGQEAIGQAWIAGLREHVPYDVAPLLNGEKVAEMWDENNDVIVYLYPENTDKGPSFKVSSTIFQDSRTLNYLCQSTHMNGNRSGAADNHPTPEITSSVRNLRIGDSFGPVLQRPLAQSQTTPNFSTPGLVGSTRYVREEKAVRLPLELENDYAVPGSIPSGDDAELVVLYRNFFSFLAGGALIATPRQNSLYSIFMGISSILRRLQYGNDKGSSWGTIPWSSFSRYTDELGLADVRSSREKNVEALILGEAMRSWPLYNEGFAHAVGRLNDIKSIKTPKFGKISPITMNRLERAHLDLQQRLGTVKLKLDNFDFPSMFAGIANSQTATEARLVRFKAWKQAFSEFRLYLLAQLKRRYGAWPPKASSKKNSFEESGLNRQLLREVYTDLTDLYDMLVDRTQLTTRSVDMPTLAEDATGGSNETTQHALRAVESEYDRSTPPVLPPIPFDVPLIPAYANSFNREHVLSKKDPTMSKKLKDNEINALLLGSYNRESIKPTTFCQDFLAYERKLGQGKSVQELVDYRCGQWLFLYAVLQSLPLLVVDARDLKYTEGVEYFLCMAPRGGRPWMREDTSTSRAWYNVASGGGLISLPADLIDHSVEGIYRRSHCYEIANTWADAVPHSPVDNTKHPPTIAQIPPTPSVDQSLSPFHAPITRGPAQVSPHISPLLRPVSAGSGEPQSLSSTGSRPTSRGSMYMGLEEVTAPVEEPRKPVNAFNPNITFDDILGANQQTQKKGKKSKK